VSAAAAAAVELPLLAALWLGHVDGSRLVGVAFLDPATRCDQRDHSSNPMLLPQLPLPLCLLLTSICSSSSGLAALVQSCMTILTCSACWINASAPAAIHALMHACTHEIMHMCHLQLCHQATHTVGAGPAGAWARVSCLMMTTTAPWRRC
jgi:hypothetical protein